MNILHITAHMGGGIGTVISGVCIHDQTHQHSIMCLEPSREQSKLNECVSHHISVYYKSDINVTDLLEQFDIVQIEWWHHPLTAQFMAEYLDKIKTRLVIWSHISGCHYPVIPYAFVTYPDVFVFATPYSYDNPSWSNSEREKVRTLSMLAVSSGNDFSVPPVCKRGHYGFIAGYVGFLGYEKTSPDFVRLCERCADLPGIRFRIVGDPAYGQDLVKDVQGSPCASLFEFRGFSDQVAEELAEFDLFICLLQKEHTGASENALLEAMHHAVCPVVFQQCTEQYLVKNNETGIVCGSAKEFEKAVKVLYEEPEKREQLGTNAAHYVDTHYSIGHTIEALHKAYQKAAGKEKNFHPGAAVFGRMPSEWFLTCYTDDKKRIRGTANGKSKGSIHQYYKYFPDPELKRLIREGTGIVV